jgi:hypothetical protein
VGRNNATAPASGLALAPITESIQVMVQVEHALMPANAALCAACTVALTLIIAARRLWQTPAHLTLSQMAPSPAGWQARGTATSIRSKSQTKRPGPRYARALAPCTHQMCLRVERSRASLTAVTSRRSRQASSLRGT